MPRFDFQSPGAAAYGQIQDFLEKRHAEQRQAMLDQLTRQNVESEIATRKGSLENDQKATAHRILMERLGQIPDETDVSTLEPDLLSEARKLGKIKKTGGLTPGVGTAYSIAGGDNVADQPETQQPSSPLKEVFAGSQDYQKEQRARRYIDDWMAQHPKELAGNPELATQLGLVQAGAMNGVSPDVTEGDSKFVHVGPTGKFGQVQTFPRGTKPIETGYPPASGAYNRDQFVGTDPKTGRPIVMSPNGTFRIAPIQDNGKPTDNAIGPKPVAPKVDPYNIVPQQAWAQLTAARRATNIGAAQRQAAIQQATANIIAQAKVSEIVKANVAEVMKDINDFDNNGLPRPSMEEYMNDPAISNFTATEREQFYSLLYGLMVGSEVQQ